jgi:hypothetical protein
MSVDNRAGPRRVIDTNPVRVGPRVAALADPVVPVLRRALVDAYPLGCPSPGQALCTQLFVLVAPRMPLRRSNRPPPSLPGPGKGRVPVQTQLTGRHRDAPDRVKPVQEALLQLSTVTLKCHGPRNPHRS